MLVGCLAGFLAAFYANSVLAAIALDALAGGAIALLLAVMTITLRANQVVTGVTVNLLCLGLTTYVYRALFGVSLVAPSIPTMHEVVLPVLSQIPIIGPVLFQQKPSVYVALLLAFLLYFVFYKTTIGLRVRAVGENPTASETMGVNIIRTRYLFVHAHGRHGRAGRSHPLGRRSWRLYVQHVGGTGFHGFGHRHLRSMESIVGSPCVAVFRSSSGLLTVVLASLGTKASVRCS